MRPGRLHLIDDDEVTLAHEEEVAAEVDVLVARDGLRAVQAGAAAEFDDAAGGLRRVPVARIAVVRGDAQRPLAVDQDHVMRHPGEIIAVAIVRHVTRSVAAVGDEQLAAGMNHEVGRIVMLVRGVDLVGPERAQGAGDENGHGGVLVPA